MATITCSMDLSNIAQARRFVTAALGSCSEDTVEVARLLTSELVTNALVHARSSFDVGVSEDGGVVRVAVTDQGQGAPVVAPDLRTAEGGRGLRLLDVLAIAWGVEERLPGKTVWFDLHCHGVPTPA
jgi:anti-sigma regulatory factor (Ser/Thr protein kinase)